MLRVAIRNLFAHKFRSLALVFTVVLGVSFVTGTYVLTDTITRVFDNIFTDVYAGIDVSVRHTSALGLDAVRPPIPEELLDDVLGVEGVRTAEGNVFTLGVDIIDAEGDRVGNPQAPSFGTSWSGDETLSPFTMREGRPPATSSEVVIDARSFDSGDFRRGDSVLLVTPTGPKHVTIVGVAGFGRASNLAGATISIFDLATAQTVLDRAGQFDAINVSADDSVADDILQERIASTLASRYGESYEAITSADLSNESSDSVATALGFFRTFMLVFAFVALFVGAFIVYNTYSIVIAERTRELALVRAIGASGAAVLGSVLIEAVITGVVASGIGLGAGVLIAMGLKRLLDAFGFSMPSGDMVLLGRTVLVAMIGGPLITSIASVVPAIRASRVAPVAAMQESALGRRNGVARNIAGAIGAAAGITLVLLGLDRGELAVVGVGAIAMFVGIAMIAPMMSRPVVSLIGIPVERGRGVAGQLARENARRAPRRTGTTASALMIGTALMAASFVLSESITTSVDRAVTGSAVADLVITGNNQIGFSAALAGEVEAVPDVASVARYRFGKFKLGSAVKNLVGLPAAALDPRSATFVLDVGIEAGDISSLPGGGIAVQSDVARDHHWSLGDAIEATLPTGTQQLTLVATYEENTLVGDYVVDLSTFTAAFAQELDFLLLVQLVDPSQLAAVQGAIKDLVDAQFPGLRVQDREEYIADVKAQVAQFTSLITALLLLAIVIALIGVLITMLLSVSERTRELGLLRAVGMSRRQVRSMVRWEAAIVSFYGALLGLALGIFLGRALVSALSSQGLTVTVVPVVPLIVLALAIAVLGVIASVYPARRAARLNVIAAVSSL